MCTLFSFFSSRPNEVRHILKSHNWKVVRSRGKWRTFDFPQGTTVEYDYAMYTLCTVLMHLLCLNCNLYNWSITMCTNVFNYLHVACKYEAVILLPVGWGSTLNTLHSQKKCRLGRGETGGVSRDSLTWVKCKHSSWGIRRIQILAMRWPTWSIRCDVMWWALLSNFQNWSSLLLPSNDTEWH